MTDPHERRENITSNFGPRVAPTAGASSNHPAIDIGVPDGTHVIAAGGGTVVSAGDAGGYGNQVVVDHGTVNGHHVQTCYSHLSGFHVNVGDTVQKGQYIADSGHSRNRYRSSLRF